MFASPLLAAAASLLLATALADDSSPYSKFVDDANAVLAAATGKDAAQLDALNSWQATQTALPSADIESQYQDYLNAYMTATSAPLPTWVTAIPSSLQAAATSFLQAEASLVVQDIAPIFVSQYSADVSAAQATPTVTTLTSNDTTMSTSAPPSLATPSSGFATLSANSTSTAQVSGSGTAPVVSTNSTGTNPPVGTAGGAAPTNSVTPPVKTFRTSGAEKRAGVAVVAALVGVLGMMLLL